jgi:uncharacterized protein (TIGR02611 family)
VQVTRQRDGEVPESREDKSVLDEISRRFGFREALRRNRLLDVSYRVGVGVVGTLIIIVGIILLPLPGPGWLVIFAGLFVLSTEFEWAERLLHFARDKVHGWTEWVKAQSLVVRMLIALGSLLILAAALWVYVAWQGIPGWIPLIR